MDNQIGLKATAIRNGNTITISVESAKAFSVKLVNVKAAAAEGAELAIEGNDTILTSCAGTITVTL